MDESSSRITFTGQNRTDLFDFPPEDGVLLLKQDLEKDDAEEQVVLEEDIADDDCGSAAADREVLEVFLCFLGLLAALVKSELRKVASRPPGEIGCFTFFKSV